MKTPILFFVVVFLLFLSSNCIGQNDSVQYKPSKNALYFEAGGWGGYGSLNYERIVLLGKIIRLSGRVGIWPFAKFYTLFPMGINFSLGDTKNHFEIGIGHTLQIQDDKNGQADVYYSVTTLSFGYKYQPRYGGLFFRIAFTPLIGDNSNISNASDFFPYFKGTGAWFGLSLGYSFKKKAKK